MKEIPDWPGYFADKDGNIYSNHISGTSKKTLRHPRKLKSMLTGKYFVVSLCKDGKVTNKRIHELVLRTFRGDCPVGHECCHGINGRLDNSLDNLRWGTPKENQADRIRDGTACLGEKHPLHKLTSEQVKKIREMIEGGISLGEISRRFGTSKSNVHMIKLRQTWTHV